MKIEKAAKLPGKMYAHAPKGERALSVHLFGIKYADQIRSLPSHELADLAGIPRSYGTEIRKGINLAKYVEVI